jgi:hypothetical protein
MNDWQNVTHTVDTVSTKLQLSGPVIDCPTHGQHSHYIQSYIPGHEGVWCQLCALDKLGPQARWVGGHEP